MGVNLKDIISSEPIDFEDLKRRIIAIDAHNSLYQFLSSIRQPDGTPLMDSAGNVTSHLSGLLYRTIRLTQLGIKPIYVFDGKPPALKGREIEGRREVKEAAAREWAKAKEEGRTEDARKFAARTSRLTKDMLEDSKNLLSHMGIPVVQAPAEGEAECVRICSNNDAWAVGSQDYDSLLLGAPRLVRGLTLSGSLELSMIRLEKALKDLGITREQLIDIAILAGTDFNEGVKGIGPRKALKAVKEGRIGEIKKDLEFDYGEVKSLFMNPETTDEYDIEWHKPDREAVKELLCERHDFSGERVENALNNLGKSMNDFTQKDLSKWF
ncbi:MAG: flap endonuclease-1 [Candidatus Altiarchaeota archaeon]|nr:flap endonuclease-1 [Candidatus Altiarchaeota archaeon]